MDQKETPKFVAKSAKKNTLKEWNFLPHPKIYAKELRKIYWTIKKFGKLCKPRGLTILELENFSFTFPPFLRFINFQSRKFNLSYVKKEFLWYLRGDLYDLSICDHAQIWKGIVSDKGHLNSNYGYYAFKRGGIDWVVEELKRDRESRRACFTILDSTHLNAETKDVPCTYALNFRIRNNKLNVSIRMRSLDIVYGLTNDLPCFSFMQEMVYCYLKDTYPELEMGNYHHSADSFHVYERHFTMLNKLAATKEKADKFSVILCPRMSGVKEVDFLRAGNFTNVPEEYHFTRWLLDVENNSYGEKGFLTGIEDHILEILKIHDGSMTVEDLFEELKDMKIHDETLRAAIWHLISQAKIEREANVISIRSVI